MVFVFVSCSNIFVDLDVTLATLRRLYHDLLLADIILNSIKYADDIVLLTDTKKILKERLDNATKINT